MMNANTRFRLRLRLCFEAARSWHELNTCMINVVATMLTVVIFETRRVECRSIILIPACCPYMRLGETCLVMDLFLNQVCCASHGMCCDASLGLEEWRLPSTSTFIRFMALLNLLSFPCSMPISSRVILMRSACTCVGQGNVGKINTKMTTESTFDLLGRASRRMPASSDFVEIF